MAASGSRLSLRRKVAARCSMARQRLVQDLDVVYGRQNEAAGGVRLLHEGKHRLSTRPISPTSFGSPRRAPIASNSSSR